MPEYCVTGGTGFIAAYLVKSLLEKGHRVRTTVRDPGTNCTWSDFYLVTRLKQSILDFLYLFFYQVCYAMPSTIYIYIIVINTKLFFFFYRRCWKGWFTSGVWWSQGETEDFQSWFVGRRQLWWGYTRCWWGVSYRITGASSSRR